MNTQFILSNNIALKLHHYGYKHQQKVWSTKHQQKNDTAVFLFREAKGQE